MSLPSGFFLRTTDPNAVHGCHQNASESTLHPTVFYFRPPENSYLEHIATSDLTILNINFLKVLKAYLQNPTLIRKYSMVFQLFSLWLCHYTGHVMHYDQQKFYKKQSPELHSTPTFLRDLITRIITGARYKSRSSSLCNFLWSPVIYSLLKSDTFLSTLLLNSYSLYSSLTVRPSITPKNYSSVHFIFLDRNQKHRRFWLNDSSHSHRSIYS
jgi:hypothetical protein